VQEQVDSLFGWKPENVIEWLFTNPNGPGREEQEESLLICLEGAEGPESAAAAVLDQIYSRQQAGNPALQPAASELHDEPGPCVIMTSEHDPVVLGVDLDGVCADFYGRMREVASEWFERPLDELTQNVTYGLKEWGVDTLEQYNSLHRFAVTSRDLFRTVPMVPGTRSVLRRLSDEGYRIRIITHRLFVHCFHAMAIQQTIEWLDHRGTPYSDLCFMKDKDQVGADIYIDDAPTNIDRLRRNGHYTTCFANSTNTAVASPRAENWQEVYAIVKEWRRPS
jgi:5'(3')-deoxyribonucleotidase